MSNIPTGGVLINDLPKVSSLEATDSLIVARDGLAYTGSVGSIGEATTATISDAFSEDTVYPAGSYCIYNDTLYRFTVDKSAGEWDDSVVVATNVGTEMSTSNSDISQINSALAARFKSGGRDSFTANEVSFDGAQRVTATITYPSAMTSHDFALPICVSAQNGYVAATFTSIGTSQCTILLQDIRGAGQTGTSTPAITYFYLDK